MTRAELFQWFVAERELIRTKKEFGEPDPLTEDDRLRRYWFPNIRREDDPTTVWFRATIREKVTDPVHLLLAIAAFRCFGRVRTGELLQDMFLMCGYDRDMLLQRLGPASETEKLFNSRWTMYRGPATLGAVVKLLDELEKRDTVMVRLQATLQEAWIALQEVPGLTPTLAYEIVCDLRRTIWLAKARDAMTWAAPTLTVCEGLSLLHEREFSYERSRDQVEAVKALQALLPTDPSWEMSEAQRAVCLFNMWARTTRPTRRYPWK